MQTVRSRSNFDDDGARPFPYLQIRSLKLAGVLKTRSGYAESSPISGQVATNVISKLKNSRGRDRTVRNSADQDLEDSLTTPPLPPCTTDMFIPAAVSSTSTGGTESTTVDDTIATDSIFEDDGTTGTPITNAHSHIITFTAMTENSSLRSENVGLAPPIPPHTNEMYLLEHHSSKLRKTACAQGDVAEKGSDTESMSAWNEDAKTEVNRGIEIPGDTISETSCDIGFPPPIPRRTQDMFLAQSFDPSDHTTFQIAMVPNTSYTE